MLVNLNPRTKNAFVLRYPSKPPEGTLLPDCGSSFGMSVVGAGGDIGSANEGAEGTMALTIAAGAAMVAASACETILAAEGARTGGRGGGGRGVTFPTFATGAGTGGGAGTTAATVAVIGAKTVSTIPLDVCASIFCFCMVILSLPIKYDADSPLKKKAQNNQLLGDWRGQRRPAQ